MDKIRWGIISTARIAHRFVEDFQHVENGHVTAVASRTLAKAQAFADRHRIPLALGSYQALLDDPEIDAVYVATPHALHFENSAAALRAGKAVLCEKPLTLSSSEADLLIDIAQQTGSYLLEGLWTWFLPAIQHARDWYQAGEIGQLLHLQSEFGFPIQPYSPERREYNVQLGGGVMPDMGIYPIALAYLFTGRDPASIHVVSQQAPNGVEDDVVAMFDYETCAATLTASFRCQLTNRTCLIGDQGRIVIPNSWAASECLLYRDDELVNHFSDERVSHGYQYEAAAACHDILAGRSQSPIVPLAASQAFQRHIDAVKAQCPRSTSLDGS